MSDVKMNLTQAQYGMLIRLSRTIPQAFALVEEEVEDVANGSQPSNLVKTSDETDKTAVEKTGTTIDLLPELPSEGKDAEGHPVALKSTVELSFESGTIYLELFTLDAISSETLEEASLARFSLNGTAVKYKLLSDNSMEAEVAIRSLTVHDTRPSRLTQFREIIPASKRVDNQFMIQYSQSGGLDKSSMANVAIDSPKIIFSLDPVFALLDFFTSAFPPAPEDDEELDESLKEADEQIIDPNPPTESTFALRLNVTSPTIILLANPEQADSEAVVLSINQIEMSQQGTTALSVKKMGMFLRRVSAHRGFSFESHSRSDQPTDGQAKRYDSRSRRSRSHRLDGQPCGRRSTSYEHRSSNRSSHSPRLFPRYPAHQLDRQPCYRTFESVKPESTFEDV
jgi:vacuolar protein sorting-associated protein 13A/C